MDTQYNTKCGTALNLLPHTLSHLQAHPEAADLLGEAIGKIVIKEGQTFLLVEVEMGRVIGRSALVTASVVRTDESCLFACRAGRNVPSRVVTGVEKPETSLFTVIAGKEDDGSWALYTGFAGPSAEKEPTDGSLKGDNAKQIAFWSSHALVWDESWETPFESTWNQVCEKATV